MDAITAIENQGVFNGKLAAMSKIYPWLCPLSRNGSSRSDEVKIRWDDHLHELNLKNPKRFRSLVQACLDDASVRMIAMPMSLTCEDGGHANVLIYDKSTNTVSHWEPQGFKSAKWQCDQSGKMHPALEWFLRSAFGWNYERPQQSCPRIAGIEPGGLQGGDSFCFTWAMLYMETRVANPEMSADEVARRLVGVFRGVPRQAMAAYVKGYAMSLLADRAPAPLWDKRYHPPMGAVAFERVFGKKPAAPYPHEEPQHWSPIRLKKRDRAVHHVARDL